MVLVVWLVKPYVCQYLCFVGGIVRVLNVVLALRRS